MGLAKLTDLLVVLSLTLEFYCIQIGTRLKTRGDSFMDLQRSLSEYFPSLQYFYATISSCFGLLNAILCLFSSMRLSSYFPYPSMFMLHLRSRHSPVSWGSCGANIICFPFCKGHDLCCLFTSFLKILFYVSHLVF